MNSKSKLKFYGGVGTTTGANIMFKYAGKTILVDCGLLQGTKFAEDKNFEPFKYDPKEVDFLLITHVHLDHIGKIPKLVREGFRGKIISTQETMELAFPMLKDALKVMQVRHKNRVLFEENDIQNTLNLWQGWKYGEENKLFENCSLKMMDAGHILGSAILNISYGAGENKKIIAFTGDLGNSPSPLLPDTDLPKGIDYLVIESVYGDRNHESKEERRKKLKEVILRGIKKGGAMIIPAFSIERTQVLLYEINNMIEDKEIPEIPVFVDSPLALKVTNIYKKYQKDFKKSVKEEIKKGDDIFDFSSLRMIETPEESKEIQNVKGAKIILAGSGMSEGGRVINHEAHYLPDPTATIILVGYQSVGSLGRAIQEGVKEITSPTLPYIKGGQGKQTNSFHKIKVRATIENITGYSSHKDSEHLLEFVEKVAPKKVFVIMGEPKSSLFLTQRIRDYLDIDAIYPEENKEYELN